MEPSSSYEMQGVDTIGKSDEEYQKEKPRLSAGKIFYRPGVIEEETDETSAFDSSVVDSPMLGSPGFLKAPYIQPSSSLHRIPTYSSSIGQSTVYRQDTCRLVGTLQYPPTSLNAAHNPQMRCRPYNTTSHLGCCAPDKMPITMEGHNHGY